MKVIIPTKDIKKLSKKKSKFKYCKKSKKNNCVCKFDCENYPKKKYEKDKISKDK